MLTVDGLGQNTGTGGLAGAAGTGEQVGVAHLTVGHLALERIGDVLLAHHLGKGLGPVFAVQRLVHGHTSLLTNKINKSSAVSHRAGTLAAHG